MQRQTLAYKEIVELMYELMGKMGFSKIVGLINRTTHAETDPGI